MAADALWLDGNAVAGLLVETFGAEVTDAERVCQGCGARSAVGAHRAYSGAGLVLRCPACGDVALRVAFVRERHSAVLHGTWYGLP